MRLSAIGLSFSTQLLCGIGLLGCLGGCGGNGNSTSSQPIITSITLTPAATNVQAGGTEQFAAKVSGTGSYSSAVSWSVTNSVDGNPGSISTSGLYTAPATAPNPNTVTVVATSMADPTKTGSASVVVGTSAFHITGITLSPGSATLPTAGMNQFTASVQGTGSFNSAVQWLVNNSPGGDSSVGTISTSGFYTAPEETVGGPVTVQATSVVDSSISATAQVTITQGAPVITQISPDTANASDQINILGHSLNFIGSTTMVFFTGPNGVLLPVLIDPASATPTALPLVVAHGAVSGPVYVQTLALGAAPQTSNRVAFTRLPRVRIRAQQRDLSAGESVAFQSRILGVGTAQPLSWSTDVGFVTNDGIYTAPTGLASDSFAVVTACVQGTQICDQERLGLHPFRITPSVALLAPGQTLQLDGIQASATVTPTWQLNGPGALSRGGLYTASSRLADGGGISIAATYSGVTETASVGVTGDFPGLVNRVSDYFDLNQSPFPLGTWTVNVGTAGNRAYVVSTDKIDFVTDNNYYWMDIYDITDPVNPVWIDAVEPAMRPQSTLYCDGFLYEIAYSDFSDGVPYPAAIAIYDLSGSQPQLTTKQLLPLVLTSQSGCLLTQVSSTAPMIADLYQLKGGGVVHSQYTLQTSDTSTTGRTATSDGSRIYVKLPQAQQDLVVYDLTTQPPTQVGVLDTGDLLASQLTLAGNLLFLTPGLEDQIFSHVFDISNSQPVFLGNLPTGSAIASSGTTALTGKDDSGLQMIDFSQPLQPVFTANMFDFVDARYTAALVGNHILSSEGYGGLAVYDASAAGGLIPSYLNATGAVGVVPALAQWVGSSTAFFAIGSAGGNSGVVAFDVSAQPPTFVGSFSTGTAPAQALALNGTNLYVGTVDSLLVLDVSTPSAPTQINSISSGIVSLAIAGNFLFAGTTDNRLVVYDVTQPSNPIQQTSLNLPAPALEMTISGSILLIADGTSGLLACNIATPSAPLLLSQLTPSKAVYDVAVDGNLALLAADGAGLIILDFSNPSQPKVVGQAPLDSIDPYDTGQQYVQNQATTIALLGKIAFIGVDNSNAPSQAMIYGFDYTLPTHPRLVHLGAYSNFLNDFVVTLRSNGTYLFAGLGLSLIEFNANQPRNTINLEFLPSTLREPYASATSSPALHMEHSKTAVRDDEGRYLWQPGPKLPPVRKYLHR